jgi:Domain of unknown function (DUF4907)
MIKPGAARVRRWILPVLILLATGVFFYIGYRKRVNEKNDRVLLELKPVQTDGGWGYLIYMNQHVYIRQTIIPAIPGSHPFRTREDAMAVGQKVVDRLSAGQVPMVTAAEVKAMGIYPDTLVKK